MSGSRPYARAGTSCPRLQGPRTERSSIRHSHTVLCLWYETERQPRQPDRVPPHRHHQGHRQLRRACTRELTQRLFTVEHRITRETRTLGRRCAANATGYAANTVEREAAKAARIAEVSRREAIIADRFPRVAAAWTEHSELVADARVNGYDTSTVYGGRLAQLGSVAATEDSYWGGRRDGEWVDYLTRNGGR